MNNILNASISLKDLLNLVVDKNTEIKSLEFDSMLNIYINFMTGKVRPDTLTYYEDNLKQVFKFFKMTGIYETKYIDQELIDRYIKWEHAQGNKTITINKRMGILKTALKRLEECNLLTYPNFKFEKLKEQKTQIQVISKPDLKKIIEHLKYMSVEHQVMIQLLLGTGIRRNELVNIKTANINFEKKTIYLDFTKSGKPRYIYINFNDEIIDLIKKLIEMRKCKKNPYLFASGDTHIDKKSVSSMLDKLRKDLDIDILSSHKFRHLYATELLKNGADIYTVKELLGHQDLEMTKRYLDFTNDEIKNNNQKFNPFKNL